MIRAIGGVVHVGITVANMERAKLFYGEILGLGYKGEMVMQGRSTDTLFGTEGVRVQVAYFNGSNRYGVPPIELIYFENRKHETNTSNLLRTSISEVCFGVKDIEEVYKMLYDEGVIFLSPPQYFDLTSQGFGRSKAVYFKDSEGNILELLEEME